MKEILLGLLLGALIALAIMVVREAGAAERCPSDAHPPPCGPPPKVSPEKKIEAEAAANYHANASMFFSVWEEASCDAVMLGYKPARLVCAGTKAGRIAADKAEKVQRKIAADPFDPNYEQPYDMVWRSYDELGLTGLLELSEDDPYIRNILEHIQALDAIGDWLEVAIDRAMSCYEDEQGISHLCYLWQWERVQVGLIWYGQRLQALAANYSYLADELEPDEGNGVNPAFVDFIDEFVAWTDWAGQQYQ